MADLRSLTILKSFLKLIFTYGVLSAPERRAGTRMEN